MGREAIDGSRSSREGSADDHQPSGQADAVGDGGYAEHLWHRARLLFNAAIRASTSGWMPRCKGSSSSDRWRRRRWVLEIAVAKPTARSMARLENARRHG